MRTSLLATAAIALLATSFSAPAYAGENQFFGTGIGAALGGLLGSQFGRGSGQLAATGTGVFVGGLMGNSIGRSMDRTDYMYAHRGYATYAPAPVYYSTGYYTQNYVAPPAPPPVVTVYNVPTESYCREFSQTVRIGDQIRESYGTACLQPDGSWRIIQ